MVITNAHVLNMLNPVSPPPSRLDLIIDSGLPTERRIGAEILGIDRINDLGLLKIRGENLPAPMKVVPSKEVFETMPVCTVGFPMGKLLGKQVSMRPTSVSAIRTQGEGIFSDYIQIEGAQNSGNSGGMLINTLGEVVGVCVAGMIDPRDGSRVGINFAIKGDHVLSMFTGKITEAEMGQPYLAGSEIRVPYTAKLLDPMSRVKTAAIEVWTGAPNMAPPSDDTIAGSSRRAYQLAIHETSATGELVLPPAPPGHVHWIQPAVVTADGQTRRTTATVFTMDGPPVDRKPARLQIQYTRGSVRPIELAFKSRMNARKGEADSDSESGIIIDYSAKLTETIMDRNATSGEATVQMRYNAATFDVRRNGQPPQNLKTLQEPLKHISFLAARVAMTRDGMVKEIRPDVVQVPPSSRDGLAAISEMSLQALELASIPIPNKETAPGTKWTGQSVFQLRLPGMKSSDRAVNKVSFTFLGTRIREGRAEAVIDVTGTLSGPAGRESRISGYTRGRVLFDLATGTITNATIKEVMDMDAVVEDSAVRLSGSHEARLSRGQPIGK
jgi:hypothetical protein